MALEWVVLGYAAAAEAVMVLLLTIPGLDALRKGLVAVTRNLLKPFLSVVPFCLFLLMDIYWKYETRPSCEGDFMAMLSLTFNFNCWSCWSAAEHANARNCAATFMSLPHRSRYRTCSFAKKSSKKSKRDVLESFGDLSDDKLDTSVNSAAQNANLLPSRNAVLQACTITSGLIAALGIVIRQLGWIK